jgi:hypothetical protein
MRRVVAVLIVLVAAAAHAQDALVAGADFDRLRDGTGGGASLFWIAPRAAHTFIGGATLLSLPGARWAFATAGDNYRRSATTTFNAQADLGHGSDDRGAFNYVLLRAGVTQELLPRTLFGEAEWLQADIARQQDGILRVGGTWLPRPTLTIRGSWYESFFGDGGTSLGTLRADYDLGRVTAIAGVAHGTATPALLQQAGTASAIREAFGGVAFGAAQQRWTVIATTLSSNGVRRQRLSVSCRLPLPGRGAR